MRETWRKENEQTTSATAQSQAEPTGTVGSTKANEPSPPFGISPFESLLEGLAQSPLYGPLLGPAIRRRQFEHRELQRNEEIAQAEHERKLAKEIPEPPSGRKSDKPLRKKVDLSRYFDASDLTDRQREILSLRLEFDCSQTEIARRLGLNRTTVAEHIEAGKKKLHVDRCREMNRKHRIKVKPDEFR